MASQIINLRRTVLGSFAVLVLVAEFAHQGGPADIVAAKLVKVANTPGESPTTAASAISTGTAVASGAASAAWYAPTPDDHPAPLPTPASDWGAAAQVDDHAVIRKAPPHGVDFPENN